MVLCLGHKKGTGCFIRTRNSQNTVNWENWQLCYSCARKLHPEYYTTSGWHQNRILTSHNSDKKHNVTNIGVNVTRETIPLIENYFSQNEIKGMTDYINVNFSNKSILFRFSLCFLARHLSNPLQIENEKPFFQTLGSFEHHFRNLCET